MRRPWLIAALLATASPSLAQLPTPPTEADVRALINRLHTQAAGHSSPDTRQRLEQQVAAVTGRPERLHNAAGLILTLRGYPWEGLWFLTRSALSNLEQPDVLSNTGLLLALIDRHHDAERLLLYTTHEWPWFDPAWTNLARVYCDTQEYDHAQECLDGASAAQPGSAAAEEVGLRLAMEQRNPEAAAQHAVNLSNLEPRSPLLREALPQIPEECVARAVMARAEAIPLPQTFVELDEVNDDYEEFVLEELDRQYWQAVFQRFAEIGTSTPHQTLSQLPPAVFNQLPPEMQATLRSMGAGPDEELSVLSPTESRTHYLRLSLYIDRYRRRYQRLLKPIFKQGSAERILQQQRDRVRQYHEQYAQALRAGADPVAAMNEWCRNVITSMRGAHPGFLRALAEAREQSNRLTRRHWLSTAGLITLVPEAYQGDEIAFLRRQAALSSMYYSGALVEWYMLGLRAVVLDREMAGIMADALHEAARARELEALLVRERLRAEQEAELEDGDELELEIELWVGLDLGVFSIKVQDDEVGIAGGEVLVGEVSFNWEDLEFELGVGYDTPTIGPLGGGGKVLGALRIGGSEELALGIHSGVTASAGTPVAGAEVDIIDDYIWIANAGHPDQAIIGSPWRTP